MNTKWKIYSILGLAVIVSVFTALAFAPSAYAFDGRTGDLVEIGEGETIDDDLYLAGDEILVAGTINGDLMAIGEKITITGEVTGDVWAAGRQVFVNGKVGDDLYVAAAVVTMGSETNIYDDVFSAGFSVESEQGSQLGGSLLVGAFQALVSGDISEDLLAGTNRLRLESTVGGDARVAVYTSGEARNYRSFRDSLRIPLIPVVPAGLTFGNEAEIGGQLEYTSTEVVSIPSSVTSDVKHQLPPADQQVKEEISAGRQLVNGGFSTVFNGFRRLIALLLVTALLAWLVPSAITIPSAKLQSRPWASLGTGLLGIIAVPFVLFFALGLIALVAIIFGALTLGELLGAILGIGLPALSLLAGSFFLMLGYLPQAMVAYMGGRWFFRKVHPETAEKVIWPALLGALVLGMLIAVPVLGWILEFVIVLFGLGAIILLVWERMKKPPKAEMPADTSEKTVSPYPAQG